MIEFDPSKFEEFHVILQPFEGSQMQSFNPLEDLIRHMLDGVYCHLSEQVVVFISLDED